MDERLAKKYRSVFYLLKYLFEFLILPSLLLTSTVRYLKVVLSSDDEYFELLKILFDSEQATQSVASEIFTILSPSNFIYLIIIGLYFLLLIIFIERIFKSIKLSELNLVYIYIFSFFKYLYVIGLSILSVRVIPRYFYVISKYSSVPFFSDNSSNKSEAWMNLFYIVSFCYFAYVYFSKTIVKLFLSDRITKKIYRFFAWIDYDKGYMNYYYLGKIRDNAKSYTNSLLELKKSLEIDSELCSEKNKKILTNLKENWKRINDFSKKRSDLFK